MPELWVLIVSLGAALRVTRMITDDAITEAPRTWLVTHLGPSHPLTTLLTCPWCIGFWITAVFTASAWWPPIAGHTAYQIGATLLTGSWLVGALATRVDPPG